MNMLNRIYCALAALAMLLAVSVGEGWAGSRLPQTPAGSSLPADSTPEQRAAAVDVADETQLAAAINDFNSGSADMVVNIVDHIGLTAALPAINNANSNIELTIEGNDHILDGRHSVRVFEIIDGNVTLREVNIVDGSVSASACQFIVDSCGGGIFNTGTITVSNSIVANSTAGSDCFAGTGQTITHSLVEDGTCGVTHGVDGNLTGDPLLDGLQDNGGPTETHALLSASPAIDAGDNAVCSARPINGIDQRGYLRNDGACDIGAFEANAGVPTAVTYRQMQTDIPGPDAAWLLLAVVIAIVTWRLWPKARMLFFPQTSGQSAGRSLTHNVQPRHSLSGSAGRH